MSTVIQENTIARPSWATSTDYDLGVHSGEVTVGEFEIYLSQAFGTIEEPLDSRNGCKSSPGRCSASCSRTLAA